MPLNNKLQSLYAVVARSRNPTNSNKISVKPCKIAARNEKQNGIRVTLDSVISTESKSGHIDIAFRYENAKVSATLEDGPSKPARANELHRQ